VSRETIAARAGPYIRPYIRIIFPRSNLTRNDDPASYVFAPRRPTRRAYAAWMEMTFPSFSFATLRNFRRHMVTWKRESERPARRSDTFGIRADRSN
jgi:hypothetical protein